MGVVCLLRVVQRVLSSYPDDITSSKQRQSFHQSVKRDSRLQPHAAATASTFIVLHMDDEGAPMTGVEDY
jgi:hypothetical protein